MIWVRGSRANFTAGLATSLDALLIITFAVLAWRAARARAIATHRRWALRTYIAANGVWFQRVGVFGWIVFNNNVAVGMTKVFDGWFDLSWAFGCYLLPLAVLELYLRVRETAGPRGRYVMAGYARAHGHHGFRSLFGFPWVWRRGASSQRLGGLTSGHCCDVRAERTTGRARASRRLSLPVSLHNAVA
jgi:hypothetical protein